MALPPAPDPEPPLGGGVLSGALQLMPAPPLWAQTPAGKTVVAIGAALGGVVVFAGAAGMAAAQNAIYVAAALPALVPQRVMEMPIPAQGYYTRRRKRL